MLQENVVFGKYSIPNESHIEELQTGTIMSCLFW